MKNENKRVILIRGTGTVGYELIKRLILFAGSGHPYFKWDEIIINKKNPLAENVPRIKNLFDLVGGRVEIKLCVDKEKAQDFKDIGLVPAYSVEEAIQRADVIFDITPHGGLNKPLYESFLPSDKIFVAEGSEFNKKKKFGPIFIGGINDKLVLDGLKRGERFLVVGSCNAHTIARIVMIIINMLKTFGYESTFPLADVFINAIVCRRSDDPNKEKVNTAFSFSPFSREYCDEGSYHAYNVLEAFRSCGLDGLNLKTVVAKLADPFMHCLFWRIVFPGALPSLEDRFCSIVGKDPFCAVTLYKQSNVVYWESKEIKKFRVEPWLLKDRCYSHTIVCLPTIGCRQINGRDVLEFGTFTPQDSNVIWSNLKMACMAKNPEEYDDVEFNKITAPLFEPKEI